MTFREQTKWCWLWGLVMVPVVAVLLGVAVMTPHRLAHLLHLLTLLVAFEMVLFVGIGGILRPLCKRLYHSGLEGISACRRIAGLFGLRHWLWVTKKGRDRDA